MHLELNCRRHAHPATRLRRADRRAAFTLTEILIATTILGMAMGMTMVVYLAAMKRAHHTELALKGTTEMRYATDVMSQVVRSASQLPTVSADGLQLYVPPKDLGYATVLDTTWIDMVNNVKGSKSNQRMLHVSNVALPAVVNSVFKSTDRPAGAISASDVGVYFVDASSLPVADLNDLFSAGDTITIPATAYGQKVTGTINNISNNPGNKTLTLTSNLGVDVPNGTKIAASSGRRVLFEVKVVATTPSRKTELRYYPDSRNLTKYSILARDISDAPLVNPADQGSAATKPFVIPSSAKNTVIVNLQKIPAGTSTGRTLQGLQTTVYTRTDPTIP